MSALNNITRLEGSAGVYTVYRRGGRGDCLGDVVRGDYGAFGSGWAAVPQRHIAIADPVYTIGSPVLPTRHEAVEALLRDNHG